MFGMEPSKGLIETIFPLRLCSSFDMQSILQSLVSRIRRIGSLQIVFSKNQRLTLMIDSLHIQKDHIFLLIAGINPHTLDEH